MGDRFKFLNFTFQFGGFMSIMKGISFLDVDLSEFAGGDIKRAKGKVVALHVVDNIAIYHQGNYYIGH